MIRAGKVERCSRYFLVLGKLRAVIGGQGFKLAESIGDYVPESCDHSLCTLVGQFANDDQLDGFIDHGQQE